MKTVVFCWCFVAGLLVLAVGLCGALPAPLSTGGSKMFTTVATSHKELGQQIVSRVDHNC
jgi:hypothetical protein